MAGRDPSEGISALQGGEDVNNPHSRALIACPHCGENAHHNGRAFDCEACGTRWVPHDLDVSRKLEAMAERHHRERKAYQRAQARKQERSVVARVLGWLW